ncbi:MAG: nucleotidyltransferase family protein [Methylococcales bacterium]|nr:nucleotidyltransferase family protein [Methylococcales bacterium]MDD5754492.1 nucleotidyltransferase family protein [Methylococcales bacterium]
MQAMILAAGRGERMRPLTNSTPKPLLQAAGKSLIERTIEQLVTAGFTELVINHAYLGKQIETTLGDGSQFGATIVYSSEGENGLETAGGIIHALPLMKDAPFLVVNGDIATDFPFAELHKQPVDLAHLVLVPNPEHHPTGDFLLCSDGRLKVTPPFDSDNFYTFSGIGIYSPKLFSTAPKNSTKLAPLLRSSMSEMRVTGQLFEGFWMDIGTPERLQILENRLAPSLI